MALVNVTMKLSSRGGMLSSVWSNDKLKLLAIAVSQSFRSQR